LEYPDDGGEGAEEEAPSPSLGTSSTATTGNKNKSNLKRGQHGRHQISKKKAQPLEPTVIIDTFSNQCSCIVWEKVPITYDEWRKVPKDIKRNVWGEVKRWFTYPPEGYDEDKCIRHALFFIGKALHNFRSMLNKEYMQTGRTPFEDYNFIKRDV
jgi:hypothetical protein